MDKAMALSGAAFATRYLLLSYEINYVPSMGRVNISAVRTNEALFAVLGINMGDWIAFPTVINNLGPEVNGPTVYSYS